MNIDLAEVSVCLGKKKSGKSILMEHLFEQVDRGLFIDPKEEHGPPDSAFVYADPPAALDAWRNGQKKLILRGNPSIDETLFTEYLRVFGQLKQCYLFIDEAHRWINATQAPDVLKTIAKDHVSHANNGLVLGAHQAKEIYDKIWQMADNYFIFYYGQHKDSKFKQLQMPNKHLIHELDPTTYQFVYYTNEVGAQAEIRGPVPVPSHLT